MDNAAAPSPALFFQTANAYQQSAAIKAAIDLDLFTSIGSAPATSVEIAARCGGAERGVRILCDYLTILGFLEKSEGRYALTLSTATFLNRSSSAYAGSAVEFLLSEELAGNFQNIADAVRKGGTARSEMGTLAPDHPAWISFARGMGSLMVPAAQGVADLVPLDPMRESKILDISASHGVYGLAFANKYSKSRLVALDWEPVLKITKENADRAGVGDRFTTIAGNALEVDLGTDYDIVLIPNFLHHFSLQVCTEFLRKVHAALRTGGRVAIVEFVPNPDRVTPPEVAGFSFVMLASTPEGDAYTFAEYDAMLTDAGFSQVEQHPLPPTTATAVLAVK